LRLAFGKQPIDLRLLASLEQAVSLPGASSATGWDELHVSHPQGYRRPSDTQLGCNVSQRPAGGTQVASAILRFDLSTVTHGL
jgi:hypothetical protein